MSTLEITKLVNTIDQFVRESGGEGVNKHMTVSGFIGGIIGSQLQVPSESVKNTRIYYQDIVYPVVSNYLNQINEAHIIDLEIAFESAYLIWLDRYKLVHMARVDASAMLFRLLTLSSLTHTRLDEQRLSALSEVLTATEKPIMDSIFLELLKQLQGNSGE